MQIGGDFYVHSSATFDHNSGTVILDGGIARPITLNSASVNNLEFNASSSTAEINIVGTLSVEGDLLITSYRFLSGGTVEVQGDVTSTFTSQTNASTANILFTGNADQTLSASGGAGDFPGIVINKSGGTLSVQDTVRVYGPVWTWTAGNVDTGTSTVVFHNGGNGITQTVDAAGMSFYDVDINQGAFDLNITGTMTVNNDFTLVSVGNLNSGTIAVAGDIDTQDLGLANASSSRILINGSGSQLMRASGGSGLLPGIEINKSSGVLTLSDNLILKTNTGWTWVSGNVNSGTSTVTFDAVFNGQAQTIDVSSSGMSFNNLAVDQGAWNLTLAGDVTVSGDLTLTSVDSITSGTFLVGGNLTSSDATVSGTTAITLNGTAAQSISAGGTDLPDGTLTINKLSGEATLAAPLILNGVGQDLTISQGTLDISGNDLSVNDVLTVGSSGNFQLQGGETVTFSSHVFNASSTVTYDGASNLFIVKDWDYQNLTFNGSAAVFNLAAPENIAENLTITSGIFDLSGNDFTVIGTVSNDDTFILEGGEIVSLTMDSDSGLVVYDGSGSYASLAAGDSYFNVNFSSAGTWDQSNPLDVNGFMSITHAGATFNSVGNNITLAGDWHNVGNYNAGGNSVILDGGTQSLIGSTVFHNLTKNVASTANLTFDSTGSIDITGTMDFQGASGNYLNLVSNSPGVQWNINPSGTRVVTYVAVSDSNNINGVSIDARGNNNINGGRNTGWLFDADSLYTWTNNNGAGDGNWSTPSNWRGGMVPGISNIAIFSGAYDYDANIDVPVNANGIQMVAGYSRSLSQQPGQSITLGSYGFTQASGTFIGGNSIITASGDLSITGGVFNGGTADITTFGTFSQSGGNFTSSSGIMSVQSVFNLSGGTFSHNNGTIRFFGGGNKSINIGSTPWYDLLLDGFTGQFIMNSDIDVDGDLIITGTGRFYTTNGSQMTVAGNIVTTDVDVGDNVRLIVDGNGPQTLSASGGSGAIPSLFIQKSSGSTLTLLDHIIIDGGGGIEYTSGNVDSSLLTLLELSGGNKTLDFNGLVWESNVLIDMNTTGQLYFSSDFDINGNLEIVEVSRFWTWVDGDIYVSGDVITRDTTGNAGSVDIVFDGNGPQTLSAASGNGAIPSLRIAKADSSTLTVQDTIRLDGVSNTDGWVYESGLVDVVGLTGLELTGSDKRIDAGATEFNTNVLIQMADGSGDLYIQGDFNINGNLDIQSVARFGSVGGGSGSILLSGNFTTSDTDVSTVSVTPLANFIFDGTSNQTIDTNGGTGDFPGLLLTINKPSGTVSLLADTAIDHTGHDLTIQSGELDLNGFNLTVNDVLTVNAGGILRLQGDETLTIGGGTNPPILNADSTVIYDGTSGPYTVRNWDYHHLVVNGSGGVFNLAAAESVAGDLSLSAGTLDISGNNLAVVGSFSNDAVLRLQGNEIVNLTMDTDSGTVEYDGSGAYPALAAANNYFNLIFNGPGSWAQSAALDVNSDLTVASGTFNSAGFNLNLAGNFSNSSTYTAGTNTVTLDGTAQTLSGDITFHHLDKTVVIADTLTFNAGDEFTVNGNLTLNGDAGQLLSLASSAASPWLLTMGAGTQNIDYVSVQYSDASGGNTITPVVANSSDLGLNVNWAFGASVGSVVGEIAPNNVVMSTVAQNFVYDILPTIGGGDTGIDTVAITAPAGYTNLTITDVSVNSSSLILSGACPGAPGAGEYCEDITGQVMTITLGTSVTTSLQPIQVSFSADVPGSPASSDFTATVDDNATPSISAQAVAVGNADGDALDNNSQTVTVENQAVTSVVGEITPNNIVIGSAGQNFVYDVLPTITASDSGVDTVAITAPTGYSNLSVSGVSVNAIALTLSGSCPTVAAGEYCTTTVGSVMTLTLGDKITTNLQPIQINLTADVPATPGSADFTSTVDDSTTLSIAAQAVTVGDADGDAGDNNSQTVTVEAQAVSAAVAEISPNVVGVGSVANVFSVDVLTTIAATDSGVNQLTITAPTGYSNLAATSVSVNANAYTLSASCPTLAANEYCASVTGQILTVNLGTAQSSGGVIHVDFNADAPLTSGSADFIVNVDDTTTLAIAPQNAPAGNADGDGGDNNSLSVFVGGNAVTSVIGEITPTSVTVNQQDRAMQWFTLPTILAGDTHSGLRAALSVM